MKLLSIQKINKYASFGIWCCIIKVNFFEHLHLNLHFFTFFFFYGTKCMDSLWIFTVVQIKNTSQKKKKKKIEKNKNKKTKHWIQWVNSTSTSIVSRIQLTSLSKLYLRLGTGVTWLLISFLAAWGGKGLL